MTNPMARFIDALKTSGYKPVGRGSVVRCQCPAHKGDRDSLAVSIGNSGAVVLKCHSKNCTAKEICEAVGLRESDLFPEQEHRQASQSEKVDVNGKLMKLHPTADAAADAIAWSLTQSGVLKVQRKPDAKWRYQHADGSDAGEIFRWNLEDGKKEIRQAFFKPDNDWTPAGWIACAMPSPRPLYRLPNIIDAAEVWICEGEKAADAAVSLGKQATTPTQGAKSPQLTDWSPLNGKRVIILPDNDQPGDDFVKAVCGLIRKHAPEAIIEVKKLIDDWPEIPEGGDIADWSEFFDSSDAESLRGRLEALPNRVQEYQPVTPDDQVQAESSSEDSFETFSAWDILEDEVELDEELIEGLLRRGEVCNNIASTKMGKSWFALGLGWSMSTKRRWLGRTVRGGNVLLIDNELKPKTLRHRVKLVGSQMGITKSEVKWRFDAVSLRGQFSSITEVEAKLQKYKPGDWDLIILDAKYRLFGEMDENSNSHQTKFHNTIDKIASDLNCAILMVHHATKGNQNGKSVTDVGSGGGAQSRAVDTQLILRPHADENFAVLEAVCRSFPAVAPQTIEFRFPLWVAASGVEPVLKPEQTKSDSRQEAKDKTALSELTTIFHESDPNGSGLSRYELHKKFGGGFDRLNRLIRLGINDGRIVQVGTRQERGKETELFTVRSLIETSEVDSTEHPERLFA